MKAWKKFAIVVGGYLLALVLAIAIVEFYIRATSGPDRDASGGMYAFGESLLFLAVLGVASLPATGAALFFLRACRPLWTALSVAAAILAATGIVALLALLAYEAAAPGSWLQIVALLSPLRIIAAPILAMVFVLAAVLAPVRWSRITLLIAAVSEGGVFGLALLYWLGHG